MLCHQRVSFLIKKPVQGLGKAAVDVDAVTFAHPTYRPFGELLISAVLKSTHAHPEILRGASYTSEYSVFIVLGVIIKLRLPTN